MKHPVVLSVVVLSLVLLASCAAYQPIVDMQGVDINRYNRDLADCQQYAQQVSPGEQAAVGAGAGLVFGAAMGAIFGNRHDAGRGAIAYGLAGAGVGAAHGAGTQMNVVRNCMSGRGYRVLQ
ncbi:MAG: glycine zipper family protein [bacterium]|nr:glycine zipper family protein [bacterium]